MRKDSAEGAQYCHIQLYMLMPYGMTAHLSLLNRRFLEDMDMAEIVLAALLRVEERLARMADPTAPPPAPVAKRVAAAATSVCMDAWGHGCMAHGSMGTGNCKMRRAHHLQAMLSCCPGHHSPHMHLARTSPSHRQFALGLIV